MAALKWGSWSSCTAECGCGERYQYAECPGAEDGYVCEGDRTRRENCNCQKCKVSQLH